MPNFTNKQNEYYQNYLNSLNEYQKLVQALNETKPSTDPNSKYFGVTEDRFSDENVHFSGIKRNMTQVGAEYLINCASDLFEKAKILADSMNNNNSLNPEMQEILSEVKQNMKSAQLDISMMEGADLKSLPSYMSMRRDASDVTIDISGGVETTGNFMSDRKILRYLDKSGNIQKGYFTKDNNSGITPDSIMNDLEETCPALSDLFKEIKKNPLCFNKIVENSSFDLSKNGSLNPKKDFPDLLSDYGVPREVLNKIPWNDETIQAISMLHHKGGSAESINALNKIAGIEDGNNINQRNVAMSDIATQLNIPNIVAKSEPMSIVRDGNLMQGSFMRNANGFHQSDMKAASDSFGGKELRIDYKSAGKSCSDLMIVDYICCNIDRHFGNMFYQIGPSDDGKGLLIKGIQGIDNDTSFGNIVPSDSKGINKLPSLDSMTYISDKTAKKVMQMKESSMKAMLSSRGLSDSEVDAAWKRTVKLQDRIKKGKITTLKDNEWDKAKFEVQAALLSPDSINPFYNVKLAINNYDKDRALYLRDANMKKSAYMDKEYKEFVDNPGAEKFAQINNSFTSKGLVFNPKDRKMVGFVIERLSRRYDKSLAESKILEERKKRIESGVKGLNNKVLMDDNCSIQGQIRKVNKLANKFWSPKDKDITEYKNFYSKLQEVKKFTEDLQKMIKNPPKEPNPNKPALVGKNGQLTDIGENLLFEKYKELDELNKEYLTALPAQLSRNDTKRFAIGSEIHELCVIGMEARERKVNAFNELMANSYKEIGICNAELTKAVQLHGADSAEAKMAKCVLEAKCDLGSFVGNMNEPSPEQSKTVNEALAKLTVVESIRDHQKSDPETYAAEMEMIKNGGLDVMGKELLKSEEFQKMVGQIKPANALAVKAEKYLLKEAKNLDLIKKPQHAKLISQNSDTKIEKNETVKSNKEKTTLAMK